VELGRRILRVALIAPSTPFRVPGGDTRQIMETAKGLRALGVEAASVPAARNRDFSGVDAAYRAPFRESLRTRLFRLFTWERTAELTRRAYLEVLAGGQPAAGEAA
jgi:hypothetical protein